MITDGHEKQDVRDWGTIMDRDGMNTITTTEWRCSNNGSICKSNRSHKERAQYGKPSLNVPVCNNLSRYCTPNRIIYTGWDVDMQLVGRVRLRMAKTESPPTKVLGKVPSTLLLQMNPMKA